MAETFANSEFRITRLGCSTVHNPGVRDLPPGRGMTGYLFMFFHAPLFVEDEDGRLWRDGPSLMIWPPGAPIHLETRQPLFHSWLDVDGPFLRQELKDCAIPVGRVIPLPDVFGTEKHLLDLRHELQGRREPDAVILRNTLQNLLREIGRLFKEDDSGELLASKAFQDTVEYFRRHFNEPLRIADMARRCNLSVSHFCREFRRYFGVSALGYLTEIRMQRAETLLRNHQLNVGEVAEAVGYSNPDLFRKAFRKRYNIRPGDVHRWAANNLPARHEDPGPLGRQHN